MLHSSKERNHLFSIKLAFLIGNRRKKAKIVPIYGNSPLIIEPERDINIIIDKKKIIAIILFIFFKK